MASTNRQLNRMYISFSHTFLTIITFFLFQAPLVAVHTLGSQVHDGSFRHLLCSGQSRQLLQFGSWLSRVRSTSHSRTRGAWLVPCLDASTGRFFLYDLVTGCPAAVPVGVSSGVGRPREFPVSAGREVGGLGDPAPLWLLPSEYRTTISSPARKLCRGIRPLSPVRGRVPNRISLVISF
jgi:hypothetical protein